VPSHEAIRIERARESDIPALIELLSTLFAIEGDFASDRARQRRGLELLMTQPDDRAVLLVARMNDDMVIAMASAQLVLSTAEGAPSAWIEDVVVQQGMRRRGTARLLIQELLGWAARHGATRAQLLADNANLPAHDFYRHLGWRSTQLSAWRRALQES
jgi:GNAT superfamily N-acetyltransferase